MFLATAEPGDADMAGRIERHRRERGQAWRTVEEPIALAGALVALVGATDSVVVDCLTLWVGNRQLRGDPDELILDEAAEIARLAAARRFDLVLVSNEVGASVHPETAAGLRFRDLLGMVNQRLAAVADRVVLMVAGLPLTIKDARRAHPSCASARPAP